MELFGHAGKVVSVSIILLFFMGNGLFASNLTECGCSAFDIIGYDETSVSYISMESITPGYCLDVRGTLHIDEPTNWDALTVIMREGSVIIVEDDFSLTNGTHITGCGTMWQGISTTGVGKLTLTDCTIEGAAYAVSLVTLQEFKCKNVDFVDDYIGIAAGSPFVASNDFIKIIQDGEISGCTFYTDGYLPDPYPNFYYDGDWPSPEGGILYNKMFAAVFMRNCIGLTIGAIGATGANINEVYNARNGVMMIGSTTSVVKTSFHDFSGQFTSPFIHSPGIPKINQVAIYSERSNTLINSNYTDDVYVGVWGIESSSTIEDNEINIYNGSGNLSYTKGVHQERPQSLVIYNNDIYDGYRGIWIDDGTRSFTIEDNHIVRNVSRDDNEGIRVDFYHVSSGTSPLIYNNQIDLDNSDREIAISLETVTGIKVDYNEINFDATVSAGIHNAGIVMLEATSCIISRNTILADEDYNNLEDEIEDINTGLVVVNSKNNVLHCNEMENFDANIWIVGTNNMTSVSSNFFDDANVGLELLGPCRLGIQVHKGNQWPGDFDDWGAHVSGIDPVATAEYSRFFVNGSVLGGIFLPPSYEPSILFQNNSGSALTCETASASQNQINGDRLTDFIREDIDFDRFDDEMTWMAYADLYDILLKYDSLLTYTPLDSFFSIYETEVLGELMEIRDSLSRIPDENAASKLALEIAIGQLNNDLIYIDSIISLNPGDKLDWMDLRDLKCDTLLDSVEVWVDILDTEMDAYLQRCGYILTTLSGITPGNDLEDYLKESLRIKAEFEIDGYLSSSDSTDILDMHELCPWLGGYALGMVYDVFAEFTDSVPGHLIYPCLSSAPLISSDEEVGNNEGAMSIFPNPVNDQINIQSDSKIGEVRLYDYTSKLIYQAKVDKEQFYIDVKHLNSGVYLLIVDQGSAIQTEKIIIQHD